VVLLDVAVVLELGLAAAGAGCGASLLELSQSMPADIEAHSLLWLFEAKM
jgi:hypothetical protein